MKPGRHPTIFAWLALAVIAVVMVGRLIQQQSVEWSVNEQYGYGWAVPLLCAFLFWRRWQNPLSASNGERARARCSTSTPQGDSLSHVAPNTDGSQQATLRCQGSRFSVSAFPFSVFCIVFAFIFTRWIGEANPDWRLVSWALALEVIGASLLFLYALGGVKCLKHFAFPLVFFLIAVPWPTVIEQPVIRVLTKGIVTSTVELLNAFGMVAMSHGNIIETAGGLVDVDEACSGIRSLQAALMLSLFFGELHRFTISKRIVLCGLSFALACFFNLTRTLVLSLIAAKQGSTAVQRWHDTAGISILVGCFMGVWLAALWLARTPSPPRTGRGLGEVSSGSDQRNRDPASSGFSFRPLLTIALLLLCGEVAIHFWYAEGKPVSPIHWHPEFPRTNPTFRIIELPSAIRNTLRFNEGESAAWRNNDETAWQMIYLRWKPGRVAAHLARNHTPDVCLPATGKKLREISEMPPIQVEKLSLPFRCYITEQNDRPLFVFYSLWEEGAAEQRVTTEFVTARSRWNAVLQRRRNPGQRVLEIALSGPGNLAEAEASLRSELPRLIHIDPR